MRFHSAILICFLTTIPFGMFGAALRIDAIAAAKDPATQGSNNSEFQQGVNLAKYAPVDLTADLSSLSEAERQMIPLLIRAGELMDEVFWMEAYGNKMDLLLSIKNPELRTFAKINYGPWDRLENNQPFIPGAGPKPAGANFYPKDLTAEAFETYIKQNPTEAAGLKSLYTIVRHATPDSPSPLKLSAVPYHRAFASQVTTAADYLDQAAELAPQESLKSYLSARAKALRTDEYQASDFLWMDMKDNVVDIVIGPIETYEDQLFGYKAAHEAYVLVKDMEWSGRLAKYVDVLPALQRGLPVPEKYKQEVPGSGSDLNAYDVIYYAGDCNSGSKTIAINLPNDEEVQLKKGTRRLQLKNAMRAKFDKIMAPIASALMVEDQVNRVTFDAFFANTMFHEVAHGLGIKYVLSESGKPSERTVRDELRDLYSALEEGKADILGIYMIDQLLQSGELKDADSMDYYTTFMAGIFRSVRFGASSAHGRANMIRFNFFEEMGAFTRGEDGKYRVVEEKMKQAVAALSEKILTLQGNGDYAAAAAFVDRYGGIKPTLQGDLSRLEQLGIPVDVTFNQGIDILGLK